MLHFPHSRSFQVTVPKWFYVVHRHSPTTEYLLCIDIIWKSTAPVALEEVLELYQEEVLQSIFNKHDFKDKVGLFKNIFSPQF